MIYIHKKRNDGKVLSYVENECIENEVFFFFSSRRRHTRLVSDWSSDVCSSDLPKTDQSSYLIGGTHGSLSLPNLTVWSQEEGPDWWAPISATRYPVDSVDTLVAQLQHFGEVISGNVAPTVSAADGVRAVTVIEAIKRAAQTGQTVTLE